MTYTCFSSVKNDQLKEHMFLGQNVNVSRYDQQSKPIFENLNVKQISFFWRPEEIDVSQDRIDYMNLPPHEQHIFISNLKYQTLLDSIQGRSPNVALLPVVSIPELETWIETWSFSETIHSRSYTHILRNILNDPSEAFNDIVDNVHIIARAKEIAIYYDDLINYTQLYQQFGVGDHILNGKEVKITLRELKRKLYMAVAAINVLEGVRFYVSFACSFAFAERELMEGNAKIIKMIARDESLHMTGTQHMLNLWARAEDDPEMAIIAVQQEKAVRELFLQAAKQEKDWADYLFKDGSMVGMNAAILYKYVEYITNLRARAIGINEPIFEDGGKTNPIPWINAWLTSDNVQVAPQEVEITSYLVGQIDSELKADDFDGFSL